MLFEEDIKNRVQNINLFEVVYKKGKCLKNKEKKPLREASMLLGLTEDGAEKKLKKILNKLKKSMVE